MLNFKVFCSLCIVNSMLSPLIVFLPRKYVESGICWSAILMTSLAFFSIVLNIMLIEIHCKAQQILAAKDSGLELNLKFSSIFKQPLPMPSCPELEIIKETRLETIQCIYILFGKPFGYVITMLALNIFLVFLIHSYITFGSTLASVLPLKSLNSCQIMDEDLEFTQCRALYIVYLLVFLVLQFCYLRKGIMFQEKIQMFCSVYALMVLCLTIVACIHALVAQSSYTEHVYREIPNLTNYDFGKTTKILSASCVFLMIQPQIATLFQQLNKPEGFIRLIVCCTLGVLSLTITLCIVLSLSTDKIQGNFTENFIAYSGGNNINTRPLYSFLLSYALKLLPAVLSISTASILGISALSNFQDLLHSFNLTNPNYSSSLLALFTIIPFIIASFSPDLVNSI